jgi:hypothetical protein
MWGWWQSVCDELGFTPVVTQGAFMTRAGGGASASAGYHDQGGCFDLRVWDRTLPEVSQIIRVTRRRGAASWVRDAQRGGMDPHIHLVLGTDRPLASGAAWQWNEYIEGNDGLAGRGSDYHERPRPLVLTPPQEDPMAQYEAELRKIIAQGEASKARDLKHRELTKANARLLVDIADANDDIKQRVTKSKSEVLAALKNLDADE